MRLRDDEAASPLVVIATFVLVAVVLTVVVYAVAVDRPEDRLNVAAVHEGGQLRFEVTQAAGGIRWEDVRATFVDRAGTDLAASFLHLPNGTASPGDVIGVDPQPPAGTYVLVLRVAGNELARVVTQV